MKTIKEGEKALIEKELRRIEKRDGVIDAHIVVKEARSVTSPLHAHFQWDDDRAAEEYRLWQARQLIAIVLYERVPNDLQRTYTSVIIEHKTNGDTELVRAYVSTERVLDDPKLRQQVLEQAVDELQRWSHKYHHFPELKDIIKAIERFRKRRELQLLAA